MGEIGTEGVNGVNVGSLDSGAGGVLRETFSIPDQLNGQSQIAIRAQQSGVGGYYAFNWFYNFTSTVC